MFIHHAIRWFRLQKIYLSEAYHFWRLTTKYNASVHTDKDIQKMQYTLSRETHTIEKGLSMRAPKKGFGKQKVLNLIGRLKTYSKLYLEADASFLEYPLTTIANYIEYMHREAVEINLIEREFLELREMCGNINTKDSASIILETKEHILANCNRNFESLLYSRHSMRYFSDEVVPQDLIDKALELAQRTPSACNRQGWLTHVFRDPQSVELIKWQGGSHGFEEEIKCCILVSANLKAFLSYEVHQAYIDGGLYAMNLINALHSLGLGTIPLSCGFLYGQLKKLSNFGIPENEVPILIIGVGMLPKSFNVAISERKPISRTNTNH